MELHVIIDNLPADDMPQLHSEHGLCLHFAIDGKNYLVDTGASGKALENMDMLYHNGTGVSQAEDIGAVFISHGHNDHTGGVRKFIERNPAAPIYLHSSIRGNYFFSSRPKNGVREARSIGMEQALFAEYEDRFREIEGPTCITDRITLIPITCTKEYATPMGNEFLYKNDFPDNFSHETAILVEHTPGEYTVISPCTHNGILNVLECCREYIVRAVDLHQNGHFPAQVNVEPGAATGMRLSGRVEIKYFVGGLHYVDYLQGCGENKEAAQIIGTAHKLKELYPALKVFSGHCTCSAAGELMQGILGENYSTFCTGATISCI